MAVFMFRSCLITLFISILTIPSLLLADHGLEALDRVVTANGQPQPGLQNYLANIETSRFEEMIASSASDIPPGIKPLAVPVVTKFWQRNSKSLVYVKQLELAPYVEKMLKQLTANLAVEFNEMLLPAAQEEQRRNLLRGAKIKSSEVALAEDLFHHMEITFEKPTDLKGAFYVSSMPLPQKQVKTLTFDIDTKTNTVRELGLVSDNGLRLTMEIRYLKVAGWHLPERFQITSPDGKVDDFIEIKFTEVDSYLLPASMQRVIRHPDLQENLEIFFKDYQVNQPIPEDIQGRLKSQ